MFIIMNKSTNSKYILIVAMDLAKIILRKLYRRRIIGGKHTAVEHLIKGLQKHAAMLLERQKM